MTDLKKYTDYKTVLSVNVLIWCDGKILLLKRSNTKKVDPGVYSGVGGKVEPGENFYSAILREIKEETGIEKLESLKPFSVTQHPFPPQKAEWVNLYFIGKIKEQVKVESNEDGEYFWVDPKKVKNLPMVYDLKNYIEILNKNPNAFILGFFEHDKLGTRPK